MDDTGKVLTETRWRRDVIRKPTTVSNREISQPLTKWEKGERGKDGVVYWCNPRNLSAKEFREKGEIDTSLESYKYPMFYV